MSCDKTAQLHAYHDGELDVSRAQMLEAHLEGCAECRRLLGELRGLSAMISGAARPVEMPARAMSRFEGAWHASRDRGLLRIAGWLTAAAAVLLVGAILMWPAEQRISTVKSGTWEQLAVTPPTEMQNEGGSELVQVAQWMADDLSLGERR